MSQYLKPDISYSSDPQSPTVCDSESHTCPSFTTRTHTCSLFWLSPIHNVLPPQILQWKWIHPLLKIVPDKYTISFCVTYGKRTSRGWKQNWNMVVERMRDSRFDGKIKQWKYSKESPHTSGFNMFLASSTAEHHSASVLALLDASLNSKSIDLNLLQLIDSAWITASHSPMSNNPHYHFKPWDHQCCVAFHFSSTHTRDQGPKYIYVCVYIYWAAAYF